MTKERFCVDCKHYSKESFLKTPNLYSCIREANLLNPTGLSPVTGKPLPPFFFGPELSCESERAAGHGFSLLDRILFYLKIKPSPDYCGFNGKYWAPKEDRTTIDSAINNIN